MLWLFATLSTPLGYSDFSVFGTEFVVVLAICFYISRLLYVVHAYFELTSF